MFSDFKSLMEMPLVLATMIGLAVLFVTFLVLFIIFLRICRKQRSRIVVTSKARDDYKQDAEFQKAKAEETGKSLDIALNRQVELSTDLKKSKAETAAVKKELAVIIAERDAEISKKTIKKAAKKKPAKKTEKVKVYTKEELGGLTKHELLTLAKSRKLSGFYHINKDELVKFILDAQEKK